MHNTEKYIKTLKWIFLVLPNSKPENSKGHNSWKASRYKIPVNESNINQLPHKQWVNMLCRCEKPSVEVSFRKWHLTELSTKQNIKMSRSQDLYHPQNQVEARWDCNKVERREEGDRKRQKKSTQKNLECQCSRP